MDKPNVKHLKDYQVPPFLVDKIDLKIELFEEYTTVKSLMSIKRNKSSEDKTIPLVLDGNDLELLGLTINSTPVPIAKYKLSDETLSIDNAPDEFLIEITTKIKPHENTSLEGLYYADGTSLTQCEAEGFRRITYFPDRPDVMSKYTCTISGDKKKYPVLLSNGNLVESGDLEGGRHFAVWEDPFRKPSYLFAIVAGDLACIEGTFTTKSGREVCLKFYVEKENQDKCGHALESLKNAMKWDEEVYGLEYDLDIYMIVATHSFNAGAMENKGLNIFNSKYVLAKPETATDTDFQGVEAVIAHEYFHNWTGNRVTLNNWFQLSLKEGLTVFRDQEFSSDMGSRAIERISNVRQLRAAQFPEDAGPMAHPIRPESYIEMNNFYTSTVYNKGAEVIRMIHTLLGREKFRKGMDLYFERFDGKAVTTEDFVKSMEDGGQTDLSQFRLWYSQAGTPVVDVKREYNQELQTYSLTLTQTIPDTPGQKNKKPMHIPVKVSLINSEGKDIPLIMDGDTGDYSGKTERVISLTSVTETFTFNNIPEKPVPSLFREFSAPVNIRVNFSDDELIFMLANDSDPFNRWDAAQQLFSITILRLVEDLQKGKELHIENSFIQAFGKTLNNKKLDKALISQALTLPSESELGDKMACIDVNGIHEAREFLMDKIAAALYQDFKNIYQANRETDKYTIDQSSIARRMLKNLALSFLARVNNSSHDAAEFVFREFNNTGNMTDEIAALSILTGMTSTQSPKAVQSFYDKWKSDPLVLDKWFGVQAASKQPGTLKKVRALTKHPDFSIKNPNKVRALIGTFCQANPWSFHQNDGDGYRFLADTVIELDSINPSIASRMVTIFNKWKKFDPKRQDLMKAELERIINTDNLSKAVFEIVSKALV